MGGTSNELRDVPKSVPTALCALTGQALRLIRVLIV